MVPAWGVLDIRAADAKEVGVGNPAEETYCHPNSLLYDYGAAFVNTLIATCRGLFKSGRIEGLYLAKADRSFWEVGEEYDRFVLMMWRSGQDGVVA